VVGSLSFFVNAGIRFIEETCKMRAFTQLWDRICLERYGVTEPKLRREVAIDLDALVNTINLASSLDLSGHEHVARSVLNHGFPDITNRSIDEYRVNAIKDELAGVLTRFEPRLIRQSVAVERDETLDKAELKIRFVVRADLNCEPLNVPIQFVADVELDTGKIAIKSS
jgi:type VI secretion system protein ImpF